MIRMYVVTDAMTNTDALVEAASQAQAVGIIVGKRYSARAANPLDVLKIMQDNGAIVTRMHQQAPAE